MKPYLISPLRIVNRSKEFKPTEKIQVIGGDWDKWGHTFDGSVLFYSSFKHVLDNNYFFDFGNTKTIPTWENTPYYQYILRKIENSEKPWGCIDVEQLNARCKKLEEIFIDIRDNGWKDDDPHDRVGINLDRNGGILFNNGRHRLTFAKILMLDKIPVNINVEHEEWKKFKDECIYPYYYRMSQEKRIYAPIINHPDLEHCVPVHGHDRYEIIKKSIIENDDIGSDFCRSAPLLDIGAHWGYFSHQFAMCNYNVVAVEIDNRHYHILNKLSKIFPNVQCHHSSIFDIPPGHHYGVVLAMNIFHHFLKTREKYDKLIVFLRDLSFDVMFFQPHNPAEGQMKGAYVNFKHDEFAWWVAKATGKSQQLLGKSKSDSRPIYKIS